MVNSYVALGDSFTAGNGLAVGSRWPDLLADELAAGRSDFEYRNLARDGADSRAVLDEIETAIQLQPDLVTLVCGANDVLLRTRPDVTTFRQRFNRMLDRLTGSIPGVWILVSTYPDGWALPNLGPRSRRRVDTGIRAVNRAIIEAALLHGVACLDVTSHPGVREPGNLGEDGLHPSAAGHRRAAHEYSAAIRRHFGFQDQHERRRISA